MDITNALNKQLAFVLWGENERGEDKVVVYSGVLIQKGLNYYFRHDKNGIDIEILPEWYPRIKPVPEDMKEMLLDCDYFITLSVGNAEGMEGTFENTGLKWPEEEN